MTVSPGWAYGLSALEAKMRTLATTASDAKPMGEHDDDQAPRAIAATGEDEAGARGGTSDSHLTSPRGGPGSAEWANR